jgi:endoglucanase
MSRGRPRAWLAAALTLVVGSLGVCIAACAGLSGGGAAGAAVRARVARPYGCSDAKYPATRDPSNPLMLRTAPGPDPLNGAHFFVDGPRHGSAAGAIASLLGIDPTSFSDGYSWKRFEARLDSGDLHRKLVRNPVLAYKVHLLEKIADQPEPQRFSAFSGGGGPGAVLKHVQKIFCHNLKADPGAIPIISTYFAHPDTGYCASHQAIADAVPTFRRQVDEVIEGTGRRPVVYLLEIDGIGSTACMARTGTLSDYEALLRYEIDQFSKLPHAVVYIEAGYSDANSVGYTARALNKVGVRKIRGFFTNDTHLNWTIKEIRWAEQISRRTHGARFIVNTAQNGNGPKLNPHPRYQGVEDLCNPLGRGLGPRLTTNAGFPLLDALMWTHTPGNSSGHCRGGPDPGTFWAARAIDLAAHANARLGPGYASDPY